MSYLVNTEIATFAQKYNIPVEQAYTLPAIFDKVASVANQPVRVIIRHATYNNPSLADYIKELAAKIA